MKKIKMKRASMLLASCALVTVAGSAAAQTTSSPTSDIAANTGPVDPDPGAPEDIIVTAQKRNERLQDVPLAVTAISADALASRQITDTYNLVKAVPALTFQQGPNPIASSFRIRGVGTSLFGLGVEASVSVVVDGVVNARAAQGFSELADLERIEVLRGPQGTLFGKNATAGVINVVTAAPSDTLEGRGEVTVAERGEYRARGTVSGPITDTLRARISGFYNDVRGHVYNTTLGRHVNGFESYGIREKLEWTPTENLTLLAIGEYRRNDADCCQSVLVKAVNPLLAQLSVPAVARPSNRIVTGNMLSYAYTNQSSLSLQADYDFGASTLTSITAYQKYHQFQNADVDAIDTSRPRFFGAGSGANGTAAAFDINAGQADLDNFTQEVRLASNSNHRFTYVIGGYYSDLGIDRTFQRRRAICATGTFGAVCPSPVYQSASHFARLTGESYAAFGQIEYRLVGGLKVIGGLRAQRETVAVRGVRTGAPLFAGDQIFPGLTANSGRRSDSDNVITGKGGLQYEFSRQAQAYATYTRGYKGLGFDTEITANFATQLPVLPEHVDAYELGFKGRTTDGKLSFAAAIFRADYTNLQVQANRSDVATGAIAFIQTNAGSSRSQGVELEATFRPARNFTVGAAFSYTDTSVDVNGLNCPLQFQGAANASTPIATNFPVNACFRSSTIAPSGATVISGPQQNVRDGVLPASPKVRVNISPRYETDIAGTGLASFAQANLSFQSKQFFAIEQDPLLTQGAYTLVDASIGIRDLDSHYSLTLFVKNLFDTNYYTSVAHSSLLASTANPFDLYAQVNKDSRRFGGATLGVKF